MTIDQQARRENAEIMSVIDTLLGNYAAALDWQDWSKWLNLFEEDCYYAVTSRQNADSNLPLCYMIDDCRARLHDRVKFITEVWKSTIEPYRTRHTVQRVSTERVSETVYKVISNLVVTYTQNNDPSSVLVTGYYEDVIHVSKDIATFSSKIVCIDGTPARYLAYPL